MVSMLDFESEDPSSNLGGAYFYRDLYPFFAYLFISEECTKVYIREVK